MIGIGAIISYRSSFQQEQRKLMITLIVNVAMPAMIFVSFLHFPKDNQFYFQLFIVFIFSLVLYMIAIMIGYFIAKWSGAQTNQVREMAVIGANGNTGFIGIPLCTALFGTKGTLLAAAFDIGLGVSLWTVGVFLLQPNSMVAKLNLKPLLNFPIITFVVGMIISVLHISLPEPMIQIFTNLGSLATPLALIFIGLMIPKLLQTWRFISLYYLSTAISVKLVLLPLITALLLSFFQMDPQMKLIILMLSAMPTGSMVPIVFAQFRRNVEFGASATVFATLLSLFTIPVLFLLSG